MAIDAKKRVLEQGWDFQGVIEPDGGSTINLVKGADHFPLLKLDSKIDPEFIMDIIAALGKHYEPEPDYTSPEGKIKEILGLVSDSETEAVFCSVIQSDGRCISAHTQIFADHAITQSLLACEVGKHVSTLRSTAVSQPISVNLEDEV